jgi:hypothetical protein
MKNHYPNQISLHRLLSQGHKYRQRKAIRSKYDFKY